MSHSRLLALLGSTAVTLALLAGSPSAARPSAPAAPTQTVSIRVLPQIAAAGASPESADAALGTVEAAFAPAAAGRPVVLEVKSREKWAAVATTAQDSVGRVRFNVSVTYGGTPATYRVMAPRTAAWREVTSLAVGAGSWGSPILSHEFAGTALPAVWDQRIQGYEVPSRRCSKTDPRATAVGGGVLALSVMDDPAREDLCTFTNGKGEPESTFYRLNGHIGTQGRFSYKYGVAAARVKFQDARGQHGAFWMQPAGTGYGAEIDVIEWFGTGSSGLGSGVWDYSSGTQVRAAGGALADQASYGSDWAGTYHVFSVEWTPSEYVFRIDGKETLRTTAGVSQTEEYLILSLLVSNFEAKNLPSPDALPQTMNVDWVRVWQR